MSDRCPRCGAKLRQVHRYLLLGACGTRVGRNAPPSEWSISHVGYDCLHRQNTALREVLTEVYSLADWFSAPVEALYEIRDTINKFHASKQTEVSSDA